MTDEHRDAFYDRGWALRRAGRQDLAAKEFAAALAVDPNHAWSHASLSHCLTDLGRRAEAVAAAETAVALAPDDAFVRRAAGWALLQASRPEDALPHAREALRLEPQGFDAHVLLAETHDSRDDVAGSLAVADEVVRLAPAEPRGHRLRSTALRRLRRLDESRAAAEKALPIAPDDMWNHLVLARVAEAQRDAATAARSYREVLRLSPSNVEARAGLVRAMKLTNSPYRWATQFHAWLFSIPEPKRRLVVGAMFVGTAGLAVLPLVFVAFARDISDPFADAALRFDRDGVRLLTPSQIRQADRFAVFACLVLGGCAGMFAGIDHVDVWVGASVTAALFPAVARVRNCRPGGATYAASATGAVIGACVVRGLVFSAAAFREEDRFRGQDKQAAALLCYFAALVGVLWFERVVALCGYPWSHRFDEPTKP